MRKWSPEQAGSRGQVCGENVGINRSWPQNWVAVERGSSVSRGYLRSYLISSFCLVASVSTQHQQWPGSPWWPAFQFTFVPVANCHRQPLRCPILISWERNTNCMGSSCQASVPLHLMDGLSKKHVTLSSFNWAEPGRQALGHNWLLIFYPSTADTDTFYLRRESGQKEQKKSTWWMEPRTAHTRQTFYNWVTPSNSKSYLLF